MWWNKKKEWKTDYKNNKIHVTALIHPNVQIGANNLIGPYCMIGYAAEYKGKENEGMVIIGNGNNITGHVTIDSGTERPTRVGDDCYIMKHCHLGHDVYLHNNVTMSPGSVIGGHSIIKNNNNLGINCSIHQKVVVPIGCMIGMGAVITKRTELSEYRKYAGVPAKDIGTNKR